MTGIKVRKLSDDYSWGSIVEGVNFDTLKDDGVRFALNDFFEERGFIVFSGVEPSAKMHVAISTVFGPLKDHPTQSTPRVDEIDADTAPGAIDMHHKPGTNTEYTGKVRLNGKVLVRYSPWHFDHCYNNELNRAGVLRCTVSPPEDGRTGFVDGIELYRRFSPELRAKIEGLNIIYTLDTRLAQMRFGRPKDLYVFPEVGPLVEGIVGEAAKFPRAMHPAVWTRKTGEKVLHIGPWMSVGIEHHEDPQGEALYEAVCQELNSKAHAYWHKWKPTDMVIWDNWRMMHAVEGNDPKYERRTQRTTIKGDYGLGYFEGGKKIGEVHRELAPVGM